MKYLSDYTKDLHSQLLDKYGAFYAFSDKQFEEQKAPAIQSKDYCSLYAGLIVPKVHAKAFLIEHKEITMQGIQKDIEENTLDRIIERELSNHEAYYTGYLDDTIRDLQGYNTTPEHIYHIYNITKSRHE